MGQQKKILIVSDTHRKNDNYFALLERLGPLYMVIHCGDAEGSEYAISQAAVNQTADCLVHIVPGNNDFFSTLPRELELEIGRYHVWVTHGHTYCVSMGPERIKQEARERGADIVLFGHTHRPFLEEEGDLVTLNPGSISYPRQEGHRPSYALMELDEAWKASFRIAYL